MKVEKYSGAFPLGVSVFCSIQGDLRIFEGIFVVFWYYLLVFFNFVIFYICYLSDFKRCSGTFKLGILARLAVLV